MSHSIALSFEDGVTRFIECGPDETIADASYHAGINIPLDCRDGVCGTCKCRVESGEYDRGSYLEIALTQDEAAESLATDCPRTRRRRPSLSRASRGRRRISLLRLPRHRKPARPGGRRIARACVRWTDCPRRPLRSRWIGWMRSLSSPAST